MCHPNLPQSSLLSHLPPHAHLNEVAGDAPGPSGTAQSEGLSGAPPSGRRHLPLLPSTHLSTCTRLAARLGTCSLAGFCADGGAGTCARLPAGCSPGCTAALSLNGHAQAAAGGAARAWHPKRIEEGRRRRGTVGRHAIASQDAAQCVGVQLGGQQPSIEGVKAYSSGEGEGALSGGA